MTYYHKAVMVREVVESLVWKKDGVYLDGTIGEGGHAKEILNSLSPSGLLIGIERDNTVLEATGLRLRETNKAFKLFHASYDVFDDVLKGINISKLSGAFLDLGLSQRQISIPERGFSYQSKGPLDMRYDFNDGETAAHLLNTETAKEITNILKENGEVRGAGRLAEGIVNRRKKKLWGETDELVAFIEEQVPKKYSNKVIRQVFQALRIQVNNELEHLKAFLNKIIDFLEIGGRLVVLSYHSLEDRIVKEFGRRNSSSCLCPPEAIVCTCGASPSLRVITKHVMLPMIEEIEENSAAHSAHLRVFERI